MKVERFVVQACCGTSQIIFKTDQPITTKLLDSLKSNGFIEATNFTQAGMLYADNKDLIVMGPIGSDKLQVKCKKEAECAQNLNNFEELLLKLG